MRVYLPFDDGSSVSFDGEAFTVHKKPKDIDAVDRPDHDKPSKAESAWAFQWEKVVNALEGAYKRQEEQEKKSRAKKIYKRR